MIDEETLSKYRAEVIERFINIEIIINATISQHYFERVEKNFYFQVLYDEYFSFSLKRRILEKIVNNINTQQVQDLNRLNTIRNYFAHCGTEFIPAPYNNKKAKIIDPRDIQK